MTNPLTHTCFSLLAFWLSLKFTCIPVCCWGKLGNRNKLYVGLIPYARFPVTIALVHVRLPSLLYAKVLLKYRNLLQLEMRSVERGICPIATSTMNELFQ